MIRVPPQRGGWLEVICGPMFSGKSEEMIRRLRRAEIDGQRVVIFKPQVDDRYDATDVVSHAGARMRAVPISSVAEVTEGAQGFDVVGVDEARARRSWSERPSSTRRVAAAATSRESARHSSPRSYVPRIALTTSAST